MAGSQEVLPIRISVNLGVMAIKEYFILPRYPEQDSHDPV